MGPHTADPQHYHQCFTPCLPCFHAPLDPFWSLGAARGKRQGDRPISSVSPPVLLLLSVLGTDQTLLRTVTVTVTYVRPCQPFFTPSLVVSVPPALYTFGRAVFSMIGHRQDLSNSISLSCFTPSPLPALLALTSVPLSKRNCPRTQNKRNGTRLVRNREPLRV